MLSRRGLRFFLPQFWWASSLRDGVLVLVRVGCVVPPDAKFYVQTSVRSLAATLSVCCEGMTLAGSRVHAEFPLRSGYVESSAGGRILRELRGEPLWLDKYSRFIALQARDSGRIHDSHSTLLARLTVNQVTSVDRLNAKFSWSALSCWRRLHAWLDHADKRNLHAPFSQSSQGHCSSWNVSLVTCESMEILPLRTREKRGDHAGNYLNVKEDASTPRLKNSLMPADDLADMLFSAIANSDSVDIEHLRFEVQSRFHQNTSEKFISDLQQKLKLLKSQSMGLPAVKAMLKKKPFLFASPEEVQTVHKVLKDFFQSDEKACSILSRSPAVLMKPLEQLEKMLNTMVEFQVEKSAVERNCKVLISDPDKARYVLTFLRGWGIHAACASKMISRSVRFLSLSTDKCIQPMLEFLESTGMSKEEIIDLMQFQPDIFCKSIANNMATKYSLCQQLGINFCISIKYVIYHCMERILGQIEFFKEQGFSHEAIVVLVGREPRLLGKSKKDLKVKLDYLLHRHNRDIAEIVRFPACLCYSFKSRITPRFTYLKEKDLLNSFSLPYILSVKTSRFRSIFKVPDSVSLK